MADKKTTKEGRVHPSEGRRPHRIPMWQDDMGKIAASLDDISYTMTRMLKTQERIAELLEYERER